MKARILNPFPLFLACAVLLTVGMAWVQTPQPTPAQCDSSASSCAAMLNHKIRLVK